MNKKPRLAVQAGNFILWNICNPKLNVRFVAENMRVSVRRLERAFEANGDVSPKRFILKWKLEGAINAYLKGGTTLKAVADDFNFCDGPHLARAIKKATGKTPLSLKRPQSLNFAGTAAQS